MGLQLSDEYEHQRTQAHEIGGRTAVGRSDHGTPRQGGQELTSTSARSDLTGCVGYFHEGSASHRDQHYDAARRLDRDL